MVAVAQAGTGGAGACKSTKLNGLSPQTWVMLLVLFASALVLLMLPTTHSYRAAAGTTQPPLPKRTPESREPPGRWRRLLRSAATM